MEWTDELVIKFTRFHTNRMKGAFQEDCEFFVNQSLKIFTDLKGDVANYKYW